MQKKRILILGAGLMQAPAINSAKELNYEVVVVDANPKAVSDTKGEWIELYNTTDHDIRLKDLKIVGKKSYDVQFTGDNLIKKHDYILISRSKDESNLEDVDAEADMTLGNKGGTVKLMLNNTLLDSITYQKAKSGASWQLDKTKLSETGNDDVDNWCLSTSKISDQNSDLGTPRKENIVCPEEIHPCENENCSNHGICQENGQIATCKCDAGYTGEQCEVDINDCQPNPCENGGSCTDQVNNYSCKCKDGFKGKNCEINIDECESNPCQNGGECIDGVNQYTCNCKEGYIGKDCETEVQDGCNSNPCQNGGTCDNVGQHGYTCNCKDGYEGTNCQINHNDCEPNPCQNGGVCVDGINDYSCECPEVFMGKRCEQADPTLFRFEVSSNVGRVDIEVNTEDYQYNYSIDCDGDGHFDAENLTDDYTCRYTETKAHTVSIKGKFPYIQIESYTSQSLFEHRTLRVKQWGNNKWESMAALFYYNSANIIFNAEDVPDLSKVTDLHHAFAFNNSFKGSLQGWKFRDDAHLKLMFAQTDDINIEYDYIKKSGDIYHPKNIAELMSLILNKIPLGKIDTSQVKNMSGLFSNIDYNDYSGIEDWNTSKVTNMSYMFWNESRFNQDISGWTVSNVTDMRQMFWEVWRFNQDISGWDVSHVTDMSSMFFHAFNFDQDLTPWNGKLNNVTECQDFDYRANSWEDENKPYFPSCTP